MLITFKSIIIYCVAGGTHYNGYNKTSFYLTDFNSVESMLESAVLSIITKYNNYIVINVIWYLIYYIIS